MLFNLHYDGDINYEDSEALYGPGYDKRGLFLHFHGLVSLLVGACLGRNKMTRICALLTALTTPDFGN